MKMKKLKHLIIVFEVFLFCFLIACDGIETETFNKEAILFWQGEYDDNGCGFIFLIDGQEFKPNNEIYIDEQYKIYSEMKVNIEFYLMYEIIQYKCGSNSQIEEREGIEIIKIELITNGENIEK
jgi:hypothetical protein